MSETEYSAGPPESTRRHRDGRSLRELFKAELALHGITWCRGAGMDSDQLRRVVRIWATRSTPTSRGRGLGGLRSCPVRSSNSAALHMSATRRRSAMRSSGRITAPSSAS